MASKRTRANKPEMIHCPYCGEDYSSTYKHLPPFVTRSSPRRTTTKPTNTTRPPAPGVASAW